MLNFLYCSAAALTFSAAPSAIAPRTLRVAPWGARMMANWAELEDANVRADAMSTLDALKESGESSLWKSFRLAPRAVSLQELTMTTRLDKEVLDPTASEFSIDDISGAFFKTLIGATVASAGFAFLSDVAGMDAGFRFTGTYLIAGIPIGVMAIGSTAPGLLTAPFEAMKSASKQDETRERRARHEAAHLLCAHCLGVPVSSVSVGADGSDPAVIVYDEVAMQQPGSLVPAEALPNLAVVALSGLMAEATAYGKSFGAAQDLQVLNSMLVRATPPIPAREQQDSTRYAALMAWTIIQKHGAALDAITEALLEGKGLSACLQAAEAAEMKRKQAA